NLALFLPVEDARPLYNAYSALLVANPLIKVISYVLYLNILAHVVVSLVLTIQNRTARGEQRYSLERSSRTSPWYARSMGVLGTVLLGFLVVHMKTFWYEYHWGEVGLDENGKKDLYGIVTAAFAREWYVALYVGCMLALGYHLLHGVSSAFRTIGVYHSHHALWLERVGMVFAVVVSAAFAVIPVWMYFATEAAP
ncbi:MAG: succinate dehydrogenase, partial [Planctomycetota bacterium]